MAHKRGHSETYERVADPEQQPKAGQIAGFFGAALREARLALGLSLAELGARAGLAKSYLSALENGRRPPAREPALEALERVLNLSPGRLTMAARWERTPAPIRQEVEVLATDHRRRDGLARRLTEILAGSTTDRQGRIRGSLDEAYRSGELRRLVDRLAPEDQNGPGPEGAERRAEGPPPGAPSDGAPPQGDGRDADAPPTAPTAPFHHAARRPAPPLLAGGPPPLLLSAAIPLINRVAAGYPREFTDLGYPARVADEYVRCPDLSDPDAFAARVVGESMLPRYEEGDVVVFSPLRPVTDGCDCFARLEPDHQTTFKRVYFEKDGGGREMVRLQPLNSAFPARTLEREQVAALYAAVSVIKRV